MDKPLKLRVRCNCHLAEGAAETVSPELHDEDCALYLQSIVDERDPPPTGAGA
jgi:hypothetical protein